MAGRHLFSVLLLLGSLFLAGCRSRDLVENELRARDTQYREALEEISRSEARNLALQRELEAMRQSGKITSQQAAEMSGVRRIALGRLTGGYDNDGIPGDEALQVIVEPRDYSDRSVQTLGTVQVAALEVTPQGTKNSIGTWTVGPDQLREKWRQGLLSVGYYLILPWHKQPQTQDVRVVVRLTTLDGRVYEADKDVRVRLTAPNAGPSPVMPMRPPEIIPSDPGPVLVPALKQDYPNVPVGRWYLPSLEASVELGRPIPCPPK